MKKNIFFNLQKIAALTLFSALLFLFLGFGNFVFAALPCNQGQVLCIGAKGSDVLKLQQALNSAQGQDSGYGKISENSNYDSATKAAVSYYQSTHNLTPDGMAGPDTLKALGVTLSGSGLPTSTCALDSDCAASGKVCDPISFQCVSPGSQQKPATGAGNGLSCPPNNPLCVPDSPYDKGSLAGADTVMDLVGKVLKYLLFFAGIVAVVAMVIGGYQYIAARGNEEMVEQGQKTLTNAIIGLVVVIMAYTIVNLLVKSLTGDPTKTAYIQQIKIV